MLTKKDPNEFPKEEPEDLSWFSKAMIKIGEWFSKLLDIFF